MRTPRGTKDGIGVDKPFLDFELLAQEGTLDPFGEQGGGGGGAFGFVVVVGGVFVFAVGGDFGEVDVFAVGVLRGGFGGWGWGGGWSSVVAQG